MDLSVDGGGLGIKVLDEDVDNCLAALVVGRRQWWPVDLGPVALITHLALCEPAHGRHVASLERGGNRPPGVRSQVFLNLNQYGPQLRGTRDALMDGLACSFELRSGTRNQPVMLAQRGGNLCDGETLDAHFVSTCQCRGQNAAIPTPDRGKLTTGSDHGPLGSLEGQAGPTGPQPIRA